ncbi:hypothetical protein ABDK00_004845 [Niabella insulamsoli]|uniref:hypothetical protein n=1 Tax=Niabella insulamsoli TaxID=3144874 RepID=UPI0031FC7BE9
MKPKLTLRPLLFLLLPILFASSLLAQSSENFDGIFVDGSGYNFGVQGQSRTINGWRFALLQNNGTNDPDGTIDITNQPDQTSLAGPGDNALFLGGFFGSGTAATTATIRQVTGDPFHMLSFRVESGEAAANGYRITGYRSGSAVSGASRDFTVPAFPSSGGTLVQLTEPGWGNVDEVRFVRQNGTADILFYIDDFTVSAALPVNFGALQANLADDMLSVKWATLFETNNDHFNIEISADGKHFTTIHSVGSRAEDGNSDMSIDYDISIRRAQSLVGSAILGVLFLIPFRRRKFMLMTAVFAVATMLAISACSKDDHPPMHEIFDKDVFLRIAQVDKDGEISYSKTVKVVQR